MLYSQHNVSYFSCTLDLWRVVSSYSEEDIAAYYANATVSGSGVEKYDWDSPILTETRHLNFSADEHKVS